MKNFLCWLNLFIFGRNSSSKIWQFWKFPIRKSFNISRRPRRIIFCWLEIIFFYSFSLEYFFNKILYIFNFLYISSSTKFLYIKMKILKAHRKLFNINRKSRRIIFCQFKFDDKIFEQLLPSTFSSRISQHHIRTTTTSDHDLIQFYLL